MMTEKTPAKPTLRTVRLMLWAVVAAAVVAGAAALLLFPSDPSGRSTTPARSSLGGPFTLVGSDGKPFSSAELSGKPYVIYFGFTRCGDVCPMTLARLVKLRREAGGADRLTIVFVTIDPANDGPREVGQYAGLFNAPIIGLTGSQAQIDKVKKQYGIFAEPSPHPMAGKELEHSAIALLFDGHGKFVTTVSPNEPDSDALAELRKLVA